MSRVLRLFGLSLYYYPSESENNYCIIQRWSLTGQTQLNTRFLINRDTQTSTLPLWPEAVSTTHAVLILGRLARLRLSTSLRLSMSTTSCLIACHSPVKNSSRETNLTFFLSISDPYKLRVGILACFVISLNFFCMPQVDNCYNGSIVMN